MRKFNNDDSNMKTFTDESFDGQELVKENRLTFNAVQSCYEDLDEPFKYPFLTLYLVLELNL